MKREHNESFHSCIKLVTTKDSSYILEKASTNDYCTYSGAKSGTGLYRKDYKNRHLLGKKLQERFKDLPAESSMTYIRETLSVLSIVCDVEPRAKQIVKQMLMSK